MLRHPLLTLLPPLPPPPPPPPLPIPPSSHAPQSFLIPLRCLYRLGLCECAAIVTANANAAVGSLSVSGQANKARPSQTRP